MKNIKSLLAVGLTGLVMVGCNDLQQAPLSNVVTKDQKEQIIADNPDMMSASVNALPNMASAKFLVFGGDPRRDNDFGVPGIFMSTDMRGQDMPSMLSGYQWFSSSLGMDNFGSSYYDNYIIWQTFYNLINSCNSVAALVADDTPEPEMMYFRAQALGFRGWAYMNLAQLYQFTYAKNPEAPTVPVITELNLDEASANGCPRATGVELYEQVTNDFTRAIALLDQAEAAGITRDNMATGGMVKDFLNQNVLYGLLARKCLLTQDYVNAEIFAQKAIDMATAAGLAPYSMADVSKPGIINIADKAWLWGFYSDPNASLGLQCWGGQMMPWHGSACYPGGGVYRCINKKLFESIPASDVRKGWWFDNLNMPRTLPSNYVEYLNNASKHKLADFSPYMQVKFGAYNDAPGETVNAEDVPYMRVEELYLMLAEAQGMQSPTRGAATLQSFVQAYRNPNYVCNAQTKEIFLDEIWHQRRIELWGEGFSYYDMMRFQKGIDRRGGGFDPTLVFVVAPDDPCLIFEIVQSEAVNNPAIGNTANNAVVPSAVKDN